MVTPAIYIAFAGNPFTPNDEKITETIRSDFRPIPFRIHPDLLALCSALLQKSTKGGLVVIGGLNLGGSIDPVHNAVNVAELAIEKGATTLLVPVSARKQLNDLPDDLITKVNILYYTDAREALLKAIVE